MTMSNSGPLARTMGIDQEIGMPRNAYLATFSLAATRPFAVPDDVVGRRRGDDRCEGCRHRRPYAGPAPATARTGANYEADVCAKYRRELLIPLPTTRPCPAFDALASCP